MALAISPLSATPSLAQKSQATAADAAADHEFNMGSAEVNRYMNGGAPKAVPLSDAQVPLHLRFIERQRQQQVVGRDHVGALDRCLELSPGP